VEASRRQKPGRLAVIGGVVSLVGLVLFAIWVGVAVWAEKPPPPSESTLLINGQPATDAQVVLEVFDRIGSDDAERLHVSFHEESPPSESTWSDALVWTSSAFAVVGMVLGAVAYFRGDRSLWTFVAFWPFGVLYVAALALAPLAALASGCSA